MTITEAQARRALRHADIPWDAEVDDPREGAWVVHHHEGILGGLAAAFSVGCRSLRRAEDFFADLGVGARRALGLGRGKPCDTTLYRLLAGQSPVGLEETVFAQVKNLIARKVVRNDRLALGVMSFDGKGTWSRTDGKKVKGAQQSAYDADGSSLQTFGALRATLARWYLFGLKGNQPRLHDLAREHQHYALSSPLARTVERYRGHTIVRELYARDVAGDPAADIEAAQQLWYVCQTTFRPNGECALVEQRYFVTSIPAAVLSRDEELALVRMHWAIENGC